MKTQPCLGPLVVLAMVLTYVASFWATSGESTEMQSAAPLSPSVPRIVNGLLIRVWEIQEVPSSFVTMLLVPLRRQECRRVR